MFDGIQEVEIKGTKRGFKFGPLAVAIAEKEDGCKAGELFRKIEQNEQLAVISLFYGSAVEYCKVKSIKQDFTISDVAEWLEEIGADKLSEIFIEGMKAYTEKVSKNLKAPVQTGA